MHFRLGVDLGTTNTVAALQWPDGSVRPLLFDGSPTLPSAVCVDASGALVAGRDAIQQGRARPENCEFSPKRCIDDVIVLLGEHEVAVVELLAAVLRRVAAEAERVAGGRCAETVLTFPATWGRRRREQLRAAARAAGLGTVSLVPEPVAAAAWFARDSNAGLRPGATVVIYDFGGGTFDASAVRQGTDGFVVLAEEGLRETGGLDVDAAVVGYLGAVLGSKHPDAWQRLTSPATQPDRRARQALWDDVRAAKESLSRRSSTEIHVPLIDEIAVLGREHLDALARPLIDRTVATTLGVIRTANLTPVTVDAVFLVGGSSRLPLAATILHQRLGIAGTVLEQPELVVAQGSLFAPPSTFAEAEAEPEPPSPLVVSSPPAVAEPTSKVATEPVAARPMLPPTAPARPIPAVPLPLSAPRRARRLAILAAGCMVLLVAAVVAWQVFREDGGDGGIGTGLSASSRTTAGQDQGRSQSAAGGPGAGCAGVAGTTLVLLNDDKFLQNSDNIVPLLHRATATPAATGALNRVSDALDTEKLSGLNKSVELDRKSAETVAQEFAERTGLTGGMQKTANGQLVVGAANFAENQILANLYRIALEAAGYTVTVKPVTSRSVYVDALNAGTIHVVPEYAATLAEYLNAKANGSSATLVSSGKIETTMSRLTPLAEA